MNAPQSCQYSPLGHEVGDVSVHGSPADDHPAFAGVVPHDGQSPRLLVLRREPKTLERNRHLRRPALIVHRGSGFPDHVETLILVPAAAHHEVSLNAVRVHRQLIAALVVSVGINDHNDVVIIEDLVAVGEVCPDFRGPGIKAAETEIEVFIIIEGVHQRSDRRRGILSRLKLIRKINRRCERPDGTA